MSTTNDEYLILPMLLIFIFGYFLRSLRWKIILSPVEKITAWESFKLCMANYFINFLVPIHAGEVVKCLWLKKMKGTPVSQSLLTAYLDKLADLLPIFLLLLATPFLGRQLNSYIVWISGILLIIVLSLVVILVSLVRRKGASPLFIRKAFFILPRKFKLRADDYVSVFLAGARSLSQLSPKVYPLIGLTVLAGLAHGVLLWLYFQAFGVQLSVLTTFVGYLLLNASFILPAPPGFSGSLELSMLFIFSYLFKQDKNIVSAVAASSHVFSAILFATLGILSIALLGIRLSSLLKPDVRADPDAQELDIGEERT